MIIKKRPRRESNPHQLVFLALNCSQCVKPEGSDEHTTIVQPGHKSSSCTSMSFLPSLSQSTHHFSMMKYSVIARQSQRDKPSRNRLNPSFVALPPSTTRSPLPPPAPPILNNPVPPPLTPSTPPSRHSSSPRINLIRMVGCRVALTPNHNHEGILGGIFTSFLNDSTN